MKLAVAVVLYQPDVDVLEHIATYAGCTKHLYVVDNSTSVNAEVVRELEKYPQAHYISMDGNKGIAAALNAGIRQAMQDGMDYLMTMDQDSRFSKVVLERYLKEAEEIFHANPKAALTGIYYDGYRMKEPGKAIEVANEVITSGMIMRLSVTEKIGPYVEKLFIDYVDYEYCYRARANGYQCFMVNDCKLQHQIGGVHPIDKFGIHFYNHNEHNRVRQYYMARNVLYVMRRYPMMASKWVKNLVKAPIKTFLVENDKRGKLTGYLMGLADGLRGRYGAKVIK